MPQNDGSEQIPNRPAAAASEDVLIAENNSLRRLLSQARIDARGLSSQAAIEANERDTADRLHKLIVEELHHRIKNTLATVIAIVSQSLRGVPDSEQARQAIEGRLIALGKAHDLLLQQRWTSADLGQIVRGAISAFDNPSASRVAINGPDIRLDSGAVIAIAMTLNELCTNTTKYGALSVPQGRVDITWTLRPSPQDSATRMLRLDWIERNGPPVRPPERQGFGSRLIEMLGKQLNGQVDISFDPGGFACRLDIPLAAVMAPSPILAASEPERARATARQPR